MKVVDASVAYKWYVSEDGSAEALRLLEDLRRDEKLVMPDLALYEIANALRFNPANSEEDIGGVLDNIVEQGIDIAVANVALLKQAVRLALRHDVTVYDAVYAALAAALDCEFVTADKKLQARLSSLGNVRLLQA